MQPAELMPTCVLKVCRCRCLAINQSFYIVRHYALLEFRSYGLFLDAVALLAPALCLQVYHMPTAWQRGESSDAHLAWGRALAAEASTSGSGAPRSQ